MIVFAIDTTADYGSIALVRDGVLVEEVAMHSPEGFGAVLFVSIQKLLARHGLRVFDVDCFASATGPGSFTGARISIAAAKGLAESAGKLVAGVSNLRAIAFYGTATVRAALLDARRGEVYGGVYDASSQLLQAETVMPLEQWLDTLPDDVEIVSPTPSAFAGLRLSEAPRALAGAIGILACGDPHVDPAAIDANYVRRSDAELMWKEA